MKKASGFLEIGPPDEMLMLANRSTLELDDNSKEPRNAGSALVRNEREARTEREANSLREGKVTRY